MSSAPSESTIRWGPWVLMLTCLTIGTVGVFMGPAHGALGYAEVSPIALTAPEAATLTTVMVREGDQVRAGDTLARLDGSDLIAKRDVLTARAQMLKARTEATAQSAQADADDVAARLAVARSDVAAARAESEALEASIVRRTAWLEQGMGGADALASDEVALAAARSRARGMAAVVTELTQAMNNASAGASPDAAALTAARLELDVVQREIARIEGQLAALTVRAPLDGYVSELYASQGSRVARNAPIVDLIPSASRRVVVCLQESEAVDVSPQDEAILWPRDGRDPVTGVVLSVGALVTEPDPRCQTMVHRAEFTRPAYVRLEEGVALPAGTRVTARFMGRRPAVPVARTHADGTETP